LTVDLGIPTLRPLLVTAVTGCAKALEIVPVIEQRFVATVRDDVIYYRGRCVAHCAPWECRKESFPQCAPCTVVATLCRCRTVCIMALVTRTGACDLTRAAGAVWHDLAASAEVWRAAHVWRAFNARKPSRSNSGSKPASILAWRCSAVRSNFSGVPVVPSSALPWMAFSWSM